MADIKKASTEMIFNAVCKDDTSFRQDTTPKRCKKEERSLQDANVSKITKGETVMKVLQVSTMGVRDEETGEFVAVPLYAEATPLILSLYGTDDLITRASGLFKDLFQNQQDN